MPKLIVQKYGGMCLATPEKIKNVAAKIAERRRSGHSMIVAVSAMGKTTDELTRLAYEISPEPNRRELDMLLTTGERVSMALLSMALDDLGCEAISFTGSQAGLLTCGAHSNARILDIRPTRVQAELERGRIVVLAGFQGINPETKEITTLGRGGTDTTAVAMAAQFSAGACEIIKEVDGLCSADPHVVKSARVYPVMSHASLLEMCFWGAKILHYRSVELARNLNVPLSIHNSNDHGRGTWVRREVDMFEDQKVLAINSHHEIHHCEILNVQDMAEGWAKFSILLNQHGLAWPQVLAATFEGGGLRAMFTSDAEHLKSLNHVLATAAGIKVHRSPLCSVTLTCHGAVASDLGAKAVAALKAAEIAVAKMLLSPLSLTLILEPQSKNRAIEVLHQHFIK